MSPNPLF